MAVAQSVLSSIPNPDDARRVARSAGLHYVSDTEPGITRRRAGRGFVYESPTGRRLTGRATLARLRALAIPPAWTDVWICPDPQGHIQATGRDARGRKQYRYHPRWREVRDETKYERLVPFGHALPQVRRRVDKDLALGGLPPEKVIATIVHLLDNTLVRVGNDEYARENRSYGLTTLQDRHAETGGGRLRLQFHGKGGKLHEIELHDPQVARIVAAAQALPGQDLFQYLDERGEPRRVGSDEVNEYLQATAGEPYTAKEFRTWAGTVLAAQELRAEQTPTSQTEARRRIVAAIKRVAAELRNTPAVCRRCYVHPAVLDAYLEGDLHDALDAAEQRPTRTRWLEPEEAAVLAFLEDQ